MNTKLEKVAKILEKDNQHIYQNLKEDLGPLEYTTILVTGSKGFLGKTIISFLNFLNDFKLEEEKKIRIISIDYDDHDICTPLDSVTDIETIDYIINCAGRGSEFDDGFTINVYWHGANWISSYRFVSGLVGSTNCNSNFGG